MSWTHDRLQTLEKMWAAGSTAQEIAERLGGVTRSAVLGKVFRLGLSAARMPSKCRNSVRKNSTRLQLTAKAQALPVIRERSTVIVKRPAAAPPQWTPRPAMPPYTPKPLSPQKPDQYVGPCRWPIGEPRSPEFRFCDAPAHGGYSYCLPHCEVAYRPAGKTRVIDKEVDA